jgi:hypothetical protein
MNITPFNFEHKYVSGDIVELPNKNNDKSVFVKVLGVSVDIFDGKRSVMSTDDIVKYGFIFGKVIQYKMVYFTESLENSYYDTEEIESIPVGTMFILNLE